MFCPNCGVQSNDDAKFCYNCGYNLSNIPNRKNNVNIIPKGNQNQIANLNSPSSAVKKVDNYVPAPYDYSYNVDAYTTDFTIINNILFYLLMPNFTQSNGYLDEIYSNLNENTPEKEGREILKSGINHILDINVAEWRNDIELSFFKDISSSIIDDLNKQTRFIMDESTSSDIFLNLIINDQAKANFANQLYLIFKQSIENTYSALLNSFQALQSKKHIWKEITDSSLWDTAGSLFLGFAGGALAAANPFVGVPLLLGSFFKDKHKEKTDSAAIDIIINDYQSSLQLYDETAKKRIAAIDELRKLVYDKAGLALYQRNEMLKPYKNGRELSILYNNFIENNAKEIKDTIHNNPDLSFLLDWILEENISNKLRCLLTT